ncbi:hypothetical protein U1Q18_025782, partial [Sarracenia purpurea var. burkii]
AIAKPAPASLRGGGQSWHGGHVGNLGGRGVRTGTNQKVLREKGSGNNATNLDERSEAHQAFGHATVKCAKAQPVDTQQVWTIVNKGKGKWEDRRNMHDAPSTLRDPSVSNPSIPAIEFPAVAPTSNSFASLAEDSD